MKKAVSTLCLLVMFSFITNLAQAQVNYGVRTGVNFSKFLNTTHHFERRAGFMIGAYLNYPLKDSPLSIQPELIYTQKGWNDDLAGSVRLGYIEIPVLLKFDFELKSNFTPQVYFGPYLGINITADAYKFIGPGSFKDRVNNTDFGVVVGAGAHIQRFNLSLRYSVGLTPVFENDIDIRGKNGVISIVAGYNF